MKLKIFIAFVFIVAMHSCKQADSKPDKPNVVLILVDDYGYADISHEGNTQIKTPAIDKIAEEGVCFTNFYQSAGACAPTRASLLTGRYHLRTGVWGVHWGRDFIHTDETTFADLAKDAGYVTGAFGKWHSGKSVGYHSWNRGFDVGLESNLYQYNNTNVLINNKLVNVDGPITNVITDNAIQFIEENRDTSFICYIPYQSIHEPFNCPDDLFVKYKKQGYTDHVARLYGMIEVLDNNIGRITNKVTELGLDENTVIMFMVDDGCSPGFDLTYSTRRMNAEEKAERIRGWAKELRGTKANIYEGGVKSPCYIRWKGQLEVGKQIETVAGVIDVLPTLADLCGFKIPDTNLPIDGQSLYPLLLGETSNLDERYYFDNTNLYRISTDKINMDKPEIREMYVRHKNFKLVRLNHKLNGRDGIDYMLYDLSKDEKEAHNVINEFPQIRETLKDTLSAWYKDMLDSPHAFKSCTYNVGDWNERATFINLDGISSKTGSLKRDDGSGFEFTNWDTPGNSLSYQINVLEEGDYYADIFIDADQKDLGGTLELFTEKAHTSFEINHRKKLKSDILHLPAGKQTLTIQLQSLGKTDKAMNWMKNILVHRVPTNKDIEVIKNPEIKVFMPSQNLATQVGISHAPFNFCTNSGVYGTTINAKPNEEIELSFSADNINQISKVELFVDFDKIYESSAVQKGYVLKIQELGLHTINAMYTSKSGYQCGSQVNLLIKN
ncbi:sulfatase-like hydrolase/transferase [Labilibacter marinus]|uniref:sulfatase-like hydrolase/transferase n=1 Tax=Labilibacter marinus TaxID=1477105 RepID=UPI00094F9E74|nr:sulfatase-like hydrolase/transferase [Labilibacter marinus]